MTPRVVRDAVRSATDLLAEAGFDNARLDARLLVGQALGLEPSLLFARAEDPLSPAQADKLAALVKRRLNHEPVSRIAGQREFWGLPFTLNAATLDPRPDTETIVETVLGLKPQFAGAPVRILDLGTGSGCILIALLAEWPEASGIGVDQSVLAVDAASANAAKLGVASRADFRTGNWCEGLEGPFNIVVSNPPYIPAGDLAGLSPDVSRFDPPAALDGGADGLDAYRALLPGAFRVLSSGGWIALEAGIGQAGDIAALMLGQGFQSADNYADLAGIPRCVLARKP